MTQRRLAVLLCLVGCGTPPGPRTARPTTTAPTAVLPTAPTTTTAAPGTVPWAKSGVDWSKPPPPDPVRVYLPPKATEYRLANGIRVITVRRTRLPLVSVRVLNSVGGSVNDPRKRAGLAALTADMLDEGAGPWTATELAARLERLGADLWVGADADTGVIALDTLTSTLDESLAAASAVLTRPRFHKTDFARVKSQRLGRIRRRAEQPRQAAQIVFDRVVFGGHPYGNPISGDLATVKRIRLHQVETFYRRHWQPAHVTIVCVGDFDPATLRAMLAKRFGAWKPRRRNPPLLRTRLRKTQRPRLFVVNKPGATQTSIRYGRRIGLSRTAPRYYAASVVNTALGGSFTSRLNNRLREQLGYTYGASSSFWYGVGGATWSVSTSLEVANTVAGIKEALALVDAVTRRGIPDGELARAKQLLARRLPQQFETNADVASSFATLVRHRQPLTWHATYATRIGAVDPKRAHDFARNNWQAQELTLVVVGDLPKFLGPLLSLGLGPALELDAAGNVLRTHRAK